MSRATISSAPSAPGKRPPLDWARQAGLIEPVLLEIEHQVRIKRRRRKKTAISALSSICLLAVLLWAVPYFRDTSALATMPAHRQSLTLPDGSRVELNAQSHLHTDFRYGRRVVQLDQGEAFFSVAKDAAHPFLVKTSAGTVQVTGTEFNVMLGTGRAEVTLLEGSVEVQPPVLGAKFATAHLAPGQQLLVTGDAIAIHALSAVELESVVAWRQGNLSLEGLTVAGAVARVAAYHGKTIEIDPAVANLHLGGSFPLDDLKGFFGALEELAPVRVLKRSDDSYRIVGR